MPISVPEPVAAAPDPPVWWPLLTTAMRKTILTRLRVKGVNSAGWPA